MDLKRSLYDQAPLGFWAASLAATIWILNMGLDLFANSFNPYAGLAIPVGMFYICWVMIWYYLRDQANPVCFVGNLCLLVGMGGYIMGGLGMQLGTPEFISRYALLPIVGPAMGVLGTGLVFIGMQENARLHHTSPIARRRDSTIC